MGTSKSRDFVPTQGLGFDELPEQKTHSPPPPHIFSTLVVPLRGLRYRALPCAPLLVVALALEPTPFHQRARARTNSTRAPRINESLPLEDLLEQQTWARYACPCSWPPRFPDATGCTRPVHADAELCYSVSLLLLFNPYEKMAASYHLILSSSLFQKIGRDSTARNTSEATPQATPSNPSFLFTTLCRSPRPPT